MRRDNEAMKYFHSVINQAAGHCPSPYLSPNTSILKLNSNESPYPPSPQALAALRNFNGEWLRRYPDPYAQDFCTVAARVLDIPDNWILVDNGGDALLSLVIRACVAPGQTVVYPTPTYGLYRTLAEICGVQAMEIPWSPEQSLPLDPIVQAGAPLTLIAAPNSPWGYQISLDQLKYLAEGIAGVLVIDEAYVDFAEESALALVHAFENVIILRTLSKGYGLAGLRFGFCIAQPALLSGLFKVKDSYGVDAIAIQVAAAAMADQAYKDDCVAQIKADRQQLTLALQKIGLQVYPSQGNFVLAAHPDAKRLHHQLRQNDIWVRYYEQSDLEDKLRITIGTPEQNQRLLQRLTALL